MAETTTVQRTGDPADASVHGHVIRLLEERSARGALLVVGCAGGEIAGQAARLGYTVTSLNRDAHEPARAASPTARMILADLERDDWHTELETGPYDVVLLLDVLEHLSRPDTMLRHMRALLSERGILYVSLPNIAHARVRVHLLSGHFDYQPGGLLDEAHRRFFTFDSMQALLERSGYIIHSFQRIVAPPTGIDLPYSPQYETILRDLERHDSDARTSQFLFAVYPSDAAEQLHHLRGKLHAAQREREQEERERHHERDQARGELEALRERSDERALRERQIDDDLARAYADLARARAEGETRGARMHALESQLASVQAMLAYAQEALQQQIWVQESRAERMRVEHDERARRHAEALTRTEGDIATLEATVARKEGDVAALEMTVARKEGDVAALEMTVARTEGDIAALEATIVRMEADSAHLVGEITAKNEYIVRLEGEVSVKNSHIGHLEREIAGHHQVARRGWRSIPHRVRRFIHPVDEMP